MNDINTFGDLKQAVQTWLNRRDNATVSNIPLFINLALKQFTRLVRLPFYESTLNRTVIENNLFVEIPKDFLSVKHLAVNGKVLTRVDPETFTRNQSRSEMGKGTERSTPYYFTRVGSRIFTFPSLSVGDTISLTYNRDIPEMKDDLDSPYPLIIAPDVMLYLSLRHASTFLRDNEQEMFWAQKAADAAAAVNQQLEEAEWSGSSLMVEMYDDGE